MKLIMWNWAAILTVNLVLQVSYVISSEWELFLTTILHSV